MFIVVSLLQECVCGSSNGCTVSHHGRLDMLFCFCLCFSLIMTLLTVGDIARTFSSYSGLFLLCIWSRLNLCSDGETEETCKCRWWHWEKSRKQRGRLWCGKLCRKQLEHASHFYFDVNFCKERDLKELRLLRSSSMIFPLMLFKSHKHD